MVSRPKPASGRTVRAAFDQAIKDIQTHPTLFPLCDGIRRFITLKPHPYILIYRVDGEEARLIAVAHAKRRPGDWRNRV